MAAADPPAPRISAFVQIASERLYGDVDANALRLYMILLDRSWKSGYCWPSDRTLGDWLGGASKSTVCRLLVKLETEGCIARSTVPCTQENPTGRMITVYNERRRGVKSDTPPVSKTRRDGVSNLTPNSDPEKNKDGPLASRDDAAPEQSVEEERAGWEKLATSPVASIAAMARRKLAALDAAG